MNPRTTVTAAAALVAGSVLLGACGASVSAGSGGPTGYDAEAVAAKVREAQQKKVPDLAVDRATCPPKVTVKKGASFECTVRVAGVVAPYRTTITSVGSSKVNYHFAPAKAIVSVALAEQFLEQQLAAQKLQGVTVACPDVAVVVQDPGTTFPCSLSKGGQTQKVSILIKDTRGTIGIAN